MELVIAFHAQKLLFSILGVNFFNLFHQNMRHEWKLHINGIGIVSNHVIWHYNSIWLTENIVSKNNCYFKIKPNNYLKNTVKTPAQLSVRNSPVTLIEIGLLGTQLNRNNFDISLGLTLFFFLIFSFQKFQVMWPATPFLAYRNSDL